jgi:proline dehydrogenase
MIDINNTEIAFRIRSDNELRRAYWLFRMIANYRLVRTSNSLIWYINRLGIPMDPIVKPTVYRQFCGGVSLENCKKVVEKLASCNVMSILDYSVEGKDEEADIEKAFKETMRAVEFAGKHPNIPFSVFKPTAFAKPELLEELSLNPNPSKEAVLKGEKFRNRINKLCEKAYSYRKPILIDAEHSHYQPIIDKVVLEMMRLYNKEEAIVFNTYQMYLVNRLDILKQDIALAEAENFFLGAKFVRGAYMEKERIRAEQMNYPDPIHKDKAATDADYNESLRVSIESIHRVSIFNGTHNEESSLLLTELMKEKNLKPGDKRFWFSQLYGMSDHISFNLAAAGYNVAKYVPYGPVRHVLPYLLRRAEENTSTAGQTGRELAFIRKEIKRRKAVRVSN